MGSWAEGTSMTFIVVLLVLAIARIVGLFDNGSTGSDSEVFVKDTTSLFPFQF